MLLAAREFDFGIVRAQAVGAPRLRAVAPSESITDADLVDRARGGDHWAAEAIYRRHVRFIAGMVTRLLGRHGEAEDAVQDTFAIALEQIATLRDGAALRSWLAQIAVSQARRRFRRRRLLRALGLDRGADDATLESLASTDAGPEVRAEIAALDRVMRELAAAERVAWMLRRVEGWALDEVATACGCSLATVKRRIAAADVHVAKFVNLQEASGA